ncbi:hypothetical protein [Massilia scottii]|uniref:hypothetical protein n=1 Tax=Massilia scottii TaxID=3057166 RepID=UPI0027968ED8|nr:hypothetical protein [Massilia sp. CCM 9029]MDQ1834665.1 hypothetical protein [Massilia sp. CCM 9029]
MEKAEGDKSKEPARSRLQLLRIKGGEDFQPAMPPLDCGEHLVDLLWKWGPTMCTSMGDAPLTHQELSHCQINTGVELSGWEAETLVKLSREYFGESHRATKRDCKPPFIQAAAQYAQALRAENRQRIRAFLD